MGIKGDGNETWEAQRVCFVVMIGPVDEAWADIDSFQGEKKTIVMGLYILLNWAIECMALRSQGPIVLS